jgi:hypothetical protein
MTSPDATIDEAGVLAEQIAQEIRAGAGDLSPAHRELEKQVREFVESGEPLEEILPGGDEEALGILRRRADGRSYFDAYARVVREDLCQPGGELHRKVTQGAAATGASLVTLLLTTIGLPPVAAPVNAPVAGTVLALGVKAFCAMASESGPS